MKTVVLIACLALCYCANSQTVRVGEGVRVPTESNGAVPVNIQDQHSPAVILYLYRHDVTTSLQYSTSVDTSFVSVNTITGIEEGDAITIYEGTHIFQSIVLDTTNNIIELSSPIDYAFTTQAEVHVGPWNMTVDGSSVAQEFHIHPPPLSDFDIYTVVISITDNSEMDSKKFGGITQLPRGIVLRLENGTTHNLCLIVNNIGFSEQGYTLEYDSKAPSGVYGLRVCKNYHERNGVSLRLVGSSNDAYKIIIQDNLTSLSSMNITINGHYVTQ